MFSSVPESHYCHYFNYSIEFLLLDAAFQSSRDSQLRVCIASLHFTYILRLLDASEKRGQ